MAGRKPQSKTKPSFTSLYSTKDEEEDARAMLRFRMFSPKKINLIQTHRHWLGVKVPEIYTAPYIQRHGFRPPPTTDLSSAPRFRPELPTDLTPILLREMDENKDQVYENRLLRVTLIEDPMMGCPSVNLIFKDENRMVERLTIFGLPQVAEVEELLAIGTQLGIINPHHKLAADGKSVIRVDDPGQAVVLLGRKENMCRFCGDENAPRKCSKCKASFCNRACQVMDWQALNHKESCKKIPFATLLNRMKIDHKEQGSPIYPYL